MTDLNPQTRLFIGGEWTDAKSGKVFATINPANEETIVEVAEADAADVDLAVAAAKDALGGKWSSWPASRRQDALFRLGQLIQERSAELAALESADAGKTAFDAGKVEVPLAGEVFKYFAGWATKHHGQTSSDSRSLKYTLREPVGVCGAIIPWNFPLLMAAWKVAPALAMGNTVVLKPAEQTPLTALKLAELAAEVGIPPGVLNVVPGYGPTAGQALVEHKDVNKIAFTGSGEVGKLVMQGAAKTLKRVSLELGGKSPNIVFADADLKAAIKGALTGIFYNKGEVCAAGSRLFVERAVYDDVLAGLEGAVAKMTVGLPTDEKTRMGPVSSAEQLEKVMTYIGKGKDDGARLLAGGERVDVHGKGFFVQPTIFADVDNNMAIAQDEIFGPVLAVIPFDDDADAIAQANAVRYGLAAAVWTRDIKRALKAAAQVKAGTVWVNTYNLYDPSLPFGGFKESGFGRDLGEAALDQYTETKSVWVDLS
jgi:acyl-CoA reductase-like NAD-dependent aldehyde dehydrogenase